MSRIASGAAQSRHSGDNELAKRKQPFCVTRVAAQAGHGKIEQLSDSCHRQAIVSDGRDLSRVLCPNRVGFGPCTKAPNECVIYLFGEKRIDQPSGIGFNIHEARHEL